MCAATSRWLLVLVGCCSILLLETCTAFVTMPVQRPVKAGVPRISSHSPPPAIALEQRQRGNTVTALFATPNFHNDAMSNIGIFAIGLIPFIWASIEFWTRIAVGKPFGTGQDQVYIGKDKAPAESRGRRVLDKGALTVAYILFAIAIGTVGLTIYSVVSSSNEMMVTPPL